MRQVYCYITVLLSAALQLPSETLGICTGSQLENENMSQDCHVCGVTVHTHVYTTNSNQVKKTLLYIQVMTHLLST